MSTLTLAEQASTPSTPAAGKVKVYVNNEANPRPTFIDDGGNVHQLLGRATVDQGANRVKNKDLDDATTAIVDDADTTKKLAFSVGGNTTGIVTTIASQQATAQTMSLPITRQAETFAMKPQVAGALVASPTGTTSTTGVMMGLSNLQAGNIITPQVTGRVCIMISGVIAQSATADGAKWAIRTGTGTAPANGAALTGADAGGEESMTFLTGVLKVPFCIVAYVTGAALGTALWIDLRLAAVTAGTATMTQVNVVAFEF